VKPVALLICGALGREVKAMVDQQGWSIDVYGIPALHHFYPPRIVAAVDRRLGELSSAYRRVVVVYGDCGTAGALDAVIEKHGAVRVNGPHCYEMFAGSKQFERLSEDQPATFFLTDWLVRNFERAVVRGLGLDRYPELLPVYFRNYTDVLYLAQFPDAALLDKAAEIATYLGLPLEIRWVGLGELQSRLLALIEAAPEISLPPLRGRVRLGAA
jgi:hypothetical protein